MILSRNMLKRVDESRHPLLLQSLLESNIHCLYPSPFLLLLQSKMIKTHKMSNRTLFSSLCLLQFEVTVVFFRDMLGKNWTACTAGLVSRESSYEAGIERGNHTFFFFFFAIKDKLCNNLTLGRSATVSLILFVSHT